MKKLVFTFLFLLPLLSFAQRKEFVLVEKKQIFNNVFRDSKYETAVAIWIYAPLDQIEKFKFERTWEWFLKEPPRYDTLNSRWEVYVPSRQNQKIKIINKEFNDFLIDIDNDFPPKSTWRYELREKSQSELNRIRLTINSYPSEATVLIKEGKTNTTINNSTPYSTESLSGSVDISVSKENFFSQDTTLQLEKGKDYNLNFKLDSAVKRVDINSMPADAKLFFNDKEVSNPFIGYLPFGDYSLKLIKEDYEEINSSFTVSKENKVQSTIPMTKKMGTVTFTKADLTGAEIRIGQEAVSILNGTTIKKFPYGEYALEVQKKNYKIIKEPIKIKSENIFVPIIFEKDQAQVRKSKKIVTIALGLGGIGAGLYLMQSANKNYDAYKKASTPADAGALRRQVESADRMSPYFLGAGGLVAILGITINVDKFSNKVTK